MPKLCPARVRVSGDQDDVSGAGAIYRRPGRARFACSRSSLRGASHFQGLSRPLCPCYASPVHEDIPRLFERVPRGLFGPLGDPYAEIYWELLASLYQHEFEREPFVVLRSVALEVAERVIRASRLWIERRQDLEILAREDDQTRDRGGERIPASPGALPATAGGSGRDGDDADLVRSLARRLIARLERRDRKSVV